MKQLQYSCRFNRQAGEMEQELICRNLQLDVSHVPKVLSDY